MLSFLISGLALLLALVGGAALFPLHPAHRLADHREPWARVP
jgi:hypothetical protein